MFFYSEQSYTDYTIFPLEKNNFDPKDTFFSFESNYEKD